MAFISIMQGRLGELEAGRFQSFPRFRWQEEFAAARLAGLDGIEWIYDLYGIDDNPLTNLQYRSQMVELSRQHGVAVRSVCADYYMDLPIVRQDSSGRDDLLSHFVRLLEDCNTVGITRLVLPFVDISRIESSEDVEVAVAFIERALPSAVANGVEIHLETDLGPLAFMSLLEKLEHPSIRVNYDSGNSASLGYSCAKELEAYGDRIGSVHIKDRILGGSTVPLGDGNADLPTLFKGLADLDYQGDFVLQVARSVPGNEIEWAAHNRSIVTRLLLEAGIQ